MHSATAPSSIDRTASRPAAALYSLPPPGLRRWLIAAAVMALLHAGAFAAVTAWPALVAAPGVVAPPILIDLAPATAAPATPLDLAPGPPMQEARAPAQPSAEEPQPVAIPVAPTPLQPAAEVPAPPPRPAQYTATPAPVRHDTPATIARPRAPKTSSPPKAQRVAAIASTAAAGVSAAAATASYDAQVAAHLQRFKQYPSGARAAGEQGTAVLTFTVSRSGQVLASHLGRSSGSAALDAETLALLRRAQPLPPFPPEMPQASKTLSVPLSYSLR